MRNIGNRTHVVIRSAELLDRIRSDTRVDGAGPEQLERVVGIDLCPLGQQFLYGLFDFRWISPRDGLEELGQAPLVSRQIESELPDQVFLFRRERLARSIVQDDLVGRR